MGKLAILGLSVIVLVVHHLFFFYGHFGFDDLYYAELAQGLLAGHLDYTDHYVFRIVPLAAWAASYAVFGMGDTSSALPAMVATTGTLITLYLILQHRPTWELALAVAMYFGMKWNLFYSDKLMPDAMVAAFAFAAWAGYVMHRNRDTATGGVIAALGLFLAFNCKGTVILLVPLFLCYFVADARSRRLRWWWRMLAVVVPLLLAYLAVVYALTGAPFTRFSAIVANHYLNPCSYDVLPLAHLIERLTSGFFGMASDAKLLPHLFIATAGFIVLRLRRVRGWDAYFYPVTAVLCFLSINFMTISLTSYNPVCLDPRHVLLFSPILAVCSVRTLADLLSRFHRPTSGKWFNLVVAILIAGFLKPTIEYELYARTLRYPEVKTAMREVLGELPRPARVYGSQVLVNYGRYYTGFPDPAEEGLAFYPLDSLPACGTVPRANVPVYLLRNWYMDWHSGRTSTGFTTVLSDRGVVLQPAEQGNATVQVQRISCP